MYKYHSVKIYYKPNLLEEEFLIEKFKENAPRTYVIKDLKSMLLFMKKKVLSCMLNGNE